MSRVALVLFTVGEGMGSEPSTSHRQQFPLVLDPDLDGQAQTQLGQTRVKILVLLFLSSDCTRGTKSLNPARNGDALTSLSFLLGVVGRVVWAKRSHGVGHQVNPRERYPPSESRSTSLVLLEECAQVHLQADKADADLEKATPSVFSLF